MDEGGGMGRSDMDDLAARTSSQWRAAGARRGRVIFAVLCELRERAGEGSLILLRKVAGHRLFYLPSAFPIHRHASREKTDAHRPSIPSDLASPSPGVKALRRL